MKTVTTIIALLIVCAIAYGIYLMKREVNSFLFYDDATKDVVCQMVSPAALRNPEDCQ